MKSLRTYNVEPSQTNMLAVGNFNGGEHLHVEIEHGKYQTISCLLPSGKFVTFAFCPSKDPGEVECVDLHTTAGKPFDRDAESKRRGEEPAYPQQLIGFCRGADTFDTRKGKRVTSLATLLLHSKHYKGEVAS